MELGLDAGPGADLESVVDVKPVIMVKPVVVVTGAVVKVALGACGTVDDGTEPTGDVVAAVDSSDVGEGSDQALVSGGPIAFPETAPSVEVDAPGEVSPDS